MTPADKPRIYCWVNQRTGAVGDAFYHVLAMDERGVVLAAHASSGPGWARYDIGIDSESKHDRYRAAHPDGYELVWLEGDEAKAHPGLTAAMEKNRALREAAEAEAAESANPPTLTERLRTIIEEIHADGWRLTMGGGDTVDRLGLIQVGTGRRVAVWGERGGAS